jgi:hypothetical protein
MSQTALMHSVRTMEALVLTRSSSILILSAALAIAWGSPAFAEKITFKADMSGAQETPPNDSKGTGTANATFDTETKTLEWTIEYSGLTGEAAAAHFHGPAAAGAKAPPVVPIDGSLASPIKGTVTLPEQQANDLMGGLWYFNVHTAKFPDGEIRGQLTKQ